jgi:hypothetical protein
VLLLRSSVFPRLAVGPQRPFSFFGEMEMNAWDTHRWIGSNSGRSVKIDDQPHHHLFCVICGRNFITDPVSSEPYAVYIGALRFYRLADEVTERWCRENCPGQRLSSDDADHETRQAIIGHRWTQHRAVLKLQKSPQ